MDVCVALLSDEVGFMENLRDAKLAGILYEVGEVIFVPLQHRECVLTRS